MFEKESLLKTRIQDIEKSLKPLVQAYQQTSGIGKVLVITLNSSNPARNDAKEIQIKNYLRNIGFLSNQVYIQTVFDPDGADDIFIYISSNGVSLDVSSSNKNFFRGSKLYSNNQETSAPKLFYKSWFLENYYAHFKTTNGQFCRHRTGTIPYGHLSVVYYTNLTYPEKFNDMLYEFSKLEEKTAYEDEEQYNVWYKGAGMETGVPPSFSMGNPPSARFRTNEKNLRKELHYVIDATSSLSLQEKRDLKIQTQRIIDEITDYAREIGRKRFYHENPAYWEDKGFGHWWNRNTKKTAKSKHKIFDAEYWDFDQW